MLFKFIKIGFITLIYIKDRLVRYMFPIDDEEIELLNKKYDDLDISF
jgi:hypothetical protein